MSGALPALRHVCHGGNTVVPKTGTYLLKKGERVLQKNERVFPECVCKSLKVFLRVNNKKESSQ